jgi:chloramphenicol-sensitive protein RarD
MGAGEMNQGVVYAAAAYLSWGLLPLYWKLFQQMAAWEILAHRIVWSVVFVGLLLVSTRRWRQMWGGVSRPKEKAAILLSSLFISGNWLIFIWAVNSGHVLETSLGYYINPLINVLFGVLFLKERMRLSQWAAIALAAVGVSIITVQYGRIPWVAITLALSFACYGLTKKVVKLDSMISLAWETLIVFPVSLLYLVVLHASGSDTASLLSGWQWALLTLSGVATALPLYWFAQATKTLPLSMVGFIQYLAPSTSLLLAIFVFGEPFTTTHFISFGCIWTALVVFTVGTLRKKPTVVDIPDPVYVKKEA